ncbi:hypothetical protein DdX_01128 [Ditylenchus destructor]|uniref:Uncharacterized protein n=1 Tax=Ditylenchus destructor TaxID=166010 RepID=A0AAD4MSK4_9BILA|nr:hypothetical protein DdX_14810 [Ditylenchus destructor]KAI1728919.1 hypothetical protein DdX_01128 [Ditylenchus destructor]
MPPAKPKHHLIRDWIKPFPEGIYTTDGKIIFCQPCEKKIQCSIKSHLTQHNESDKHSENFERFQKTATRQQFLAFSQTENVDPFSKDLCNALVGANIPFYKVNNPSFNDFLSKYCNRSVPVESTLRKNYLKVCYEETMERIKQDIGESFVWVSVDETTDTLGRFVANLLVGSNWP